MAKVRELRNKLGNLVTQARTILDVADAQNRGLTAEETTEYDRINNEIDSLEQRIEREELQASRESNLNQSANGRIPMDPAEGNPQDSNQRSNPRASKEYAEAWNKYMRYGARSLDERMYAALQAGDNPDGGYTIAPQQFVSQLVKQVDDLVFIRQFATKLTLDRAESLGVPTLEQNPDDADWTTELATGNEDTGMKFGKRELRPHPLAKRIKISQKLLRQSAIDMEALVRDRLAYKFGISQEKAFLTGDGNGKPLGVFTPSADGISVNRDIVCGTANDVTADGLMDLAHGLKTQYWGSAKFLISRELLKHIRKLKDNYGQYIWAPGLTNGAPNSILNFPYSVSEYVPNTFTTGQYLCILGDFSKYWIVDCLDLQVQRLIELYAEQNQIGFIGRQETDGMPVLEEAFVRGKLA